MGAQGTGPVEISNVRMVQYFTNRLEVRFPKMGANVRAGLRTMCEALDNMLIGEVDRAADFLRQRTKAIETSSSTASGSWPPTNESLSAAKVQLQHAKLQEHLRNGGAGNR